MEDARFVTIDSFPKNPNQKRFLMYYMVRSTRITVTSFGSSHILLYAGKKRLKTFVIPETVTCGTIVNTPKDSSESNDKLLICGTDSGSVLMLELPSTKHTVSEWKHLHTKGDDAVKIVGMVGTDHRVIFRYNDFAISCISCINCHLLLTGKNDSAETELVLFQPEVLQHAISSLRGDANHKDSISSPAPQSVSINPPSASTHSCKEHHNLLVFQTEQCKSSPYYCSLGNVQYIDKSLFNALFSSVAQATTPVVCCLYPNGEIWYRALADDRRSIAQMEFLCSTQERCDAVAVALHNVASDSAETEELSLQSALLLLGEEHNAWLLSRNPGNLPLGFELTLIPYSAAMRTRVDEWNGLFSSAEAYLLLGCDGNAEIKVTSAPTCFGIEQRVGLRSTEDIWTFQDYEDHTSLLEVTTSKFLSDSCSGDAEPRDELQAALKELELVSGQCVSAKEKSSKITDMLLVVRDLATYLTDFPVIESESGNGTVRNNQLFSFEISHEVVDCGSGNRVNIIVKVTNTDAGSILNPFLVNLNLITACIGGPKSHSRVFNLDGVGLGQAKKIGVLVDTCELQEDSNNAVKLSFFLSLPGLRRSHPDIMEECGIFDTAFRLLFEIFSTTLHVEF